MPWTDPKLSPTAVNDNDLNSLNYLRALVASDAIGAISIDLDDTLWPIWPAIERAERALAQWVQAYAPQAAALVCDRVQAQQVRAEVEARYPHWSHDLGALRRETIRVCLQRSGADERLADTAFAVFMAERHRVDLFADAVPALQFLSQRWPVVSLSNGNADVDTIGIGAFFHARLSAARLGLTKPDPRMFAEAAQAAVVASHRVLHIGDDARLDVVGAMAAGMHAVWLNREGMPWGHGPVQPHATVSSLTALCQALTP